MADKPWKVWERKVAKRLGGRRTGPLGSNVPDVSGLSVSPECKYQKRLSLRRADIEQAKNNAAAHGGKPWILCLKEHGQQGGYVVCDLEHYAQLYFEAELWREHDEKERELVG